jgi:Amt family ammonium transporter
VALTELQSALALVCLLIAPLAVAGLALINTGLGRSRNAAHAGMSALCAASAAGCAYFVLGHTLQGAIGQPMRALAFAGHTWDFLGAMPPFLMRLPAGGPYTALSALAGLESAALASLIPLGGGGERWRLGSICASSAILGAITFPLFAHWTWGGGWLRNLGYIDAGGSGTIHVVGGLTALAVAWLLGPRRGKYSSEGMPMAVPGHSIVLVLFGCLLAAAGWLGLNCAGALLFAAAPPERLALVAVNTMLGAASAALVSAVVTRVRFKRPDASLAANGWIGGLVSVSAGCAILPPAAAALAGAISGALVVFSVELLELRLEIDDPGGSISVHAISGCWGLVAAGLLGRDPAGLESLFAQFVGIATLFGFILPFSWSLNAALDRFLVMRAPPEGERQGMDLYELGAGAYPDFITHTDDYLQR